MKILLTLLLAAAITGTNAASPPAFWKWAQKPPLGWNSWDSFGTTVTEAQTKGQADYMAAKLARLGWRYIVVDIQWYEPGATGFAYRKNAPLEMDAWGRLQPAPNKFPSAAGGAGFKALANHIHSKGLKFGIHIMRGIPRQAVAQNTPIQGTTARAADIADKNSICPWNPDMYGVDTGKPGAQAYYDSVYAMFAAWGVDFVKVDDLSAPYHQAEIEAIRRAIDKTRRPMVLSTSPGETPVSSGAHVQNHANMWRVSGDFWDEWPALRAQFKRLHDWTPFRGPGRFPDADMLPLGAIRVAPGSGPPHTRFTRDEQITLMSLWSIARSPLMMGGDLTRNDDFTLSLLTNAEVLAVNQNSANNRQLFNRDGRIAWIADVPGSPDKYLAVFNTRDAVSLDAQNAAFRSLPLTRRTPGHGVAVDVDVTGAKKLFLVVDTGGDGFEADHFNWSEPRLTGPGTERRLTDLPWVRATSGWGRPSTQAAVGGKAMRIDGKPVAYGIGTHADSIIEFDLPEGFTHFKAFAGLDDGGTTQPFGATVRAMVFTRPPQVPEESAGVPVIWRELGLSGPVRVRDLWQKKDLGVFGEQFAPELGAHASGLYRITPGKAAKNAKKVSPLKDAFKAKFLIGTALDYPALQGKAPMDVGIATTHFNAITPANSLKPAGVQPTEGRFQFAEGDRLVELARKSGATPIGHTLVWHEQTPNWFFTGPDGQPANRELALTRLRRHIATVVGRYRGRIKQWDVVNEAINDGPGLLRQTPWLKAIGEDYIAEAFRAAHKADPKAILIYNDYNIELAYKRPKALELLKSLLAQGVPVHAVGIQGHWRMDNPDFAEVEESIKQFAALGLKVMITELDIGVLPTKYQGADLSTVETMTPEQQSVMNPYTGGLPDTVAQRHAERYRQAFQMFLRHKDVIGRVTLWGTHDGDSWLNNFPVRGRTEYATLFDRQGKPKPAFFAVEQAARATR